MFVFMGNLITSNKQRNEFKTFLNTTKHLHN